MPLNPNQSWLFQAQGHLDTGWAAQGLQGRQSSRGLLSKFFHNLLFLKQSEPSLHPELLLEEILTSEVSEKCLMLQKGLQELCCKPKAQDGA